MSSTSKVESNLDKGEITINSNNTNLPAQATTHNLPAYLQKRMQESKGVIRGTENLAQYYVPPRLKIVQAQSGDQYRNAGFKPGDVLLVPEMSLIAHSGEPFWITPIFMFTEFCKWNPYGLKGQLPTIAERTFNIDSDIAKRAMSKNEKDWYEVCDQAPKSKQSDRQFQCRYCEHINFLSVARLNSGISDHPANHQINNPFLISFHHSGFYEGKQLSTLIVNRRVDIFTNQFEFKTGDRTNQQGTWKGFFVTNPSLDSKMSPFVESEQDALNYEAIYIKMQEKFTSGEIRPDYEDEAAEGDTVVSDSKGKF